MISGFAELLMYVAPEPIRQANERWLTRIVERLGATRLSTQGLSLMELWLAPQLLLTQTCGYPLMTALRGRVRVIGRPRYELPDSSAGNHCSVLLTRADDLRRTLPALSGCRAVINGEDSNSGMNLLRHRIAPLQRNGRFFSCVAVSGSHRESLRCLRDGRADLAAIDSVTFADQALDRLPGKVRATFLLSRLEGLTYPQIAAELGISQRSVSVYMTRCQALCQRSANQPLLTPSTLRSA